MGKSNYDDWNFVGQSSGAAQRKNLVLNNNTVSLIILVSFIALSLLGIVCVYSASYPAARALGLGDLHFALKQAIFVGIGFAAGVAILLVPKQIIEYSTPFVTLLLIIAYCINIIINNRYLTEETFVVFSIVFSLGYIAHYFGKRKNKIERLRELAVPSFIVVLFVFLILYEKNISFTVLFFCSAISVFSAGGVGIAIVFVLFLFAMVPTVCSILSSPVSVERILSFFYPGYSSSISDSSVFGLKAVSSGGWLGKGLGMGQYKDGVIDGIYDNFIFCNISEESGFLGASIVILIFFIFCFFGYKASMNSKDKFSSNWITGLVTHMLLSFVINILCCFELIPSEGSSLPFISYGSQVIAYIAEGFFVYRLSKSEGSDEVQDDKEDSSYVISEVDYDQEFR